jgi:hypothetical protein
MSKFVMQSLATAFLVVGFSQGVGATESGEPARSLAPPVVALLSGEPRALSREPRAFSREPRAFSDEPRAFSRMPREEPRALSREPRALGGPAAPGSHAAVRTRLVRDSLIRSPGGQLAATVALIVFAFFIASLTSKRGASELPDEEARRWEALADRNLQR